MNDSMLADFLLAQLRRVSDRAHGVIPSIDLAVIVFPRLAQPVGANVLLSRELSQGFVAHSTLRFGTIDNVRFVSDLLDDEHRSVAWLDGADWTKLPFQKLHGERGPRFVAPYPASLIKVMVAVGVALLVDAGRADWDHLLTREGETRRISDWADAMITVSSNTATDALVRLLHERGLLTDGRNDLQEAFGDLGLPTLRFEGSTASGGWRNADGAGVGRLQMTAWDTVRLLWTLRDDVPPPPWRDPVEPPPLSAESRRLLWHWLGDQGQHEILSTTLHADVSATAAGIPSRLPMRWLQADGRARVGSVATGPGIAKASSRADTVFAHKTGTTDHYASDAGFVQGDDGRRYLIAVISSLGRRTAPHPRLATDATLPLLGAAIDQWVKLHG